MIMFGHSFSSPMQKIHSAETKHSLLIKGRSKGHNYIFINFHLPTAWPGEKLLNDCLHETDTAIGQLTKDNERGSITMIIGGDFNADMTATTCRRPMRQREGGQPPWRNG